MRERYRRMKGTEAEAGRKRKNHVVFISMKSREQNASHQWTSAGKRDSQLFIQGLFGEGRKDRFVLLRLREDDSLYVALSQRISSYRLSQPPSVTHPLHR